MRDIGSERSPSLKKVDSLTRSWNGVRSESQGGTLPICRRDLRSAAAQSRPQKTYQIQPMQDTNPLPFFNLHEKLGGPQSRPGQRAEKPNPPGFDMRERGTGLAWTIPDYVKLKSENQVVGQSCIGCSCPGIASETLVRGCAPGCPVLWAHFIRMFGCEYRVWYSQRVSCLPGVNQSHAVKQPENAFDGIGVDLVSFDRFQGIVGHDPDVAHGRTGLGVAEGTALDHRLKLGPTNEEYRFPRDIQALAMETFSQSTPEVRDSGVVVDVPEPVPKSITRQGSKLLRTHSTNFHPAGNPSVLLSSNSDQVSAFHLTSFQTSLSVTLRRRFEQSPRFARERILSVTCRFEAMTSRISLGSERRLMSCFSYSSNEVIQRNSGDRRKTERHASRYHHRYEKETPHLFVTRRAIGND